MNPIHPSRFAVKGIREHEDSHRLHSDINVGDVERWASTIGGTILVAHGLRSRSFGGLALALIGGGLVYRGVTGHCETYHALNIDTSDKHRTSDSEHIHQGVLIKHSTTINKSPAELYAFWRDVENCPRFMSNVESVSKQDETHSHWVSTGPFGHKFAWDSQIINDQPDRLIAWNSLPGGDVNVAGSVRFEPATGGRGTVVTLEFNYEPPAGIVGLTVAKLLGEDPDRHARENLRHFKQLMETGEIPTIEGQPSGRASNRQVATPIPHHV